MMRFNLLKAFFNPILLVDTFFTLRGGDGDGGGGSQTSTSYSTNLPEYAQPFYNELLKQTGRETFTTDAAGKVTGVKPFVPYAGDRVAGFTPEQLAVQNEVRDMNTPEGFAQGAAGMTAGQQASMGAIQGGLGNALSFAPNTYAGNAVQAPNINNFQMNKARDVAARDFTSLNQNQMQAYMNPFQSAVTDIQIAEARKEADRQRSQGALGAIGRGTFGGARDALAQGTTDAAVVNNIANMRAKGQLDAYNQAMGQFNTDEGRRLQSQQSNQQSDLTTNQANLTSMLQTQGLGADQALRAALANQAAQSDYSKLNEQSRQFGATLGKDIFSTGLAGLSDSSRGLGAIAGAQQDADINRLQAQGASGAEQQALTQRGLDTNFQQAMEARDFNKQQLDFYSNILRGNAGALGSTQVQYTPAPSQLSQIAGLGLSGLALSRALGQQT